jgi:hypothetical protein
MEHLSNILVRQRNTRISDAIFAVLLALGAIVSISTLSAAVHAASTH